MKRKIPLIAYIFASVAALFGCSSQLSAKNEWRFRCAQTTSSGGAIVACSQDCAELFEGAEVTELEICVTDKNVTLKCTDSDEKYTFGYTAVSETTKSAIYDISSGEKSGYMTVSFTAYDGGKEEKTLIISIGDYALYFTEK